MADTNEDADAAAAAKKKKMIAIGALVVGALAYQFVLKGSPPPPEDEEAAVVEEGEIAPLEELVVNLADTEEIHYLRLGVAAVLSADHALDDVTPQLPKVSDVVIDTVSAKTFDELRQAGATTALKDEISEAAQEVFPDGEVVRVIFTTFVMQ